MRFCAVRICLALPYPTISHLCAFFPPWHHLAIFRALHDDTLWIELWKKDIVVLCHDEVQLFEHHLVFGIKRSSSVEKAKQS